MLKRLLSFGQAHARLLLRLFAMLLLLPALLWLAVALTIQFWVMPDIERYHHEIVALASRAAGRPVSIARIEADWEGIHPRLRFYEVRILDEQGEPLLDLPLTVNVLDWRTLWFGELRLRSLILERPELVVRRDTAGGLHVAGIPLAGGGEDGGVEMLLQLRHLEVRDARLVWQDDARALPPLPLEAVQLSLENRGDRHAFSLSTIPPEFLAASLQLRGTLHGRVPGQWRDWYGGISLQLMRFDALAWGRWFPLPQELAYARGSVQADLTIARDGLRQLDMRGELAGLQFRFDPRSPLLHALTLRGGLTWRELPRGYEVAGRELAVELGDGFTLPAGQYAYRHQAADARSPEENELRADRFDLAWLPRLLAYLPVAESWRARLADYAPQGMLHAVHMQWQGELLAPQRYQLYAELQGLSFNAVGDAPGVAALNGTLEADERGGTLAVNAPGLRLTAPAWLPEPLLFDTCVLQTGWQRHGQGWEIRLSRVQLANADLAGTLYGSYRTGGREAGHADLSLKLSRLELQRAAHYLPTTLVGEETHAWLRQALQGGRADEVRLRLRGDLADFPFVDGKDGVFQIAAQARDVMLDYAPQWPRIERMDAMLHIDGVRMEVNGRQAVLGGVQVQRAHAAIPDLMATHPHLLVEGEAAGAAWQALDYLNRSPVRAWLGDLTRDIHASGTGKLAWKLDIPLSGAEPVKLQGNYQLSDGTLDLAPTLPTLNKVNGVLLFTENTLTVSGATAEIYGDPARFDLHTEKDGSIALQARGRLSLDELFRLHPGAYAAHLHGSANWHVSAKVSGSETNVLIQSDLRGIALELPAPLQKARDQALPLRVALRLGSQHDEIDLNYGKLLHAVVTREPAADGQWRVVAGQLDFGGQAMPRHKGGGWALRGHLPELPLQQWLALGVLDWWPDAETDLIPQLAVVDLRLDRLYGWGSEVTDLQLSGRSGSTGYAIQFMGQGLNGELGWTTQGKRKVYLHLKEAMLAQSPKQDVPRAMAAGSVHAHDLPSIDVRIEQLAYHGQPLGKLELHLSQHEQEVLLDQLRLSHADVVLQGSGKWDKAADLCHLNVAVNLHDAGKVLQRVGYGDAVKGGRGMVMLDLLWPGGPDAFTAEALSGSARVRVAKGQFLKLQPGAGKLLSVLNLQALPKRVVLDFTDVFSNGFEFDEIEGDARIEQGLLSTRDFRIEGSAARVLMSGQVDLMRETQNLRVRIVPKLSDSVSLLAFAGGPVVGAGVLLANKLLRDPLDKLVAFDYNIVGSWADPTVERIATNSGAASPQPK